MLRMVRVDTGLTRMLRGFMGGKTNFFFKSGKALAQPAREVLESPSLDIFKDCGDVALRDVVQWARWGWADSLTRLS